jgi:hypothetical protein
LLFPAGIIISLIVASSLLIPRAVYQRAKRPDLAPVHSHHCSLYIHNPWIFMYDPPYTSIAWE